MLFNRSVLLLFTVVSTAHAFLLPTVAILPFFASISAASGGSRASIILVPGLYHEPIVYNRVVDVLRKFHYKRIFPIDLPSVGSMKGRADDVTTVRSILTKELDEGRDVILVGNSYGGTVISDAVEGLQKHSSITPRSPTIAGRIPRPRGKILALIYLSGFLPYIRDVQHPELKPDIRLTSPSFMRYTSDNRIFSDGDPANPPQFVFYNDLSPREADFWTSKLTWSSFDSAAANSTYIPYTGDFRCVYVIGKRDNAVPPAFARTWIEQEGARFEVRELDAGHVPMLGQPENVVGIIRDVAEGKRL